MRVSIALKIFVVVLAVLVLMAAVAAITTWEARKAGAQLDRAIDTYIPAYAALARADVRSLEQALALRRLVIAELAGLADDTLRARLRSEFETKGADQARELAAARHLIAAEVASTSPFVNVAALAQLEARLEVLQDERGAYDAQVAAVLAQLAGGNRPNLIAELERLESLRDDLNARLEQARTRMRELMLAAASQTRAEQDRGRAIGAGAEHDPLAVGVGRQ